MYITGLASSSSDKNEEVLERSEAALVERLNDGLEGRGRGFPIQFPQPLEQSFRTYNSGLALPATRAASIVLLLLLLGTGLVDFLVMPEIADALWKVRTPLVGISLASILLSYTPGFAAYSHWVVLTYLSVSAFAYLNMSHLSYEFSSGLGTGLGSSAYALMYSTLFGVGSCFLLIMSRSLFRWSVLCDVTLLVLANVHWILYQSIELELLVAYNVILISCLAMCLIANYLYEKGNRNHYLYVQKIRLARFEREELEDSSDRFRFLVSLDSVTGVANKSSLDRGYKLEWERAARRKSYLSLLVVTVDEFDGYRQCYGMIEADKCLKKVAAELKRFARRPGDIAARYGDDLFYVVLADTGVENATLVAQNMLDNIRSLDIPNDFSKVEPQVTVSIGVASLIPLPSMFTADLTDKAKKANKLSEKQGRNRVVSFSH